MSIYFTATFFLEQWIIRVMDSECVTNLMDVARQKQKRICECFIKNIGDILAYVRKRNTTQRETFKTFYTLTRFQGHMYAHREVSHALFLKLKQFWKICPANNLVNCITQSFLFPNTVSKVSESFDFLIISENISCFACLAACLLRLFLRWRQCKLKVLAKIY